jgi:hypothetical protein
VKGKSASKSVSFGVVLTNPVNPDSTKLNRPSIISESSSVDVSDGAKLSTKRKPIIRTQSSDDKETQKDKTQKDNKEVVQQLYVATSCRGTC